MLNAREYQTKMDFVDYRQTIVVFPIVLLFHYFGKPATKGMVSFSVLDAWDGSKSSMGVNRHGWFWITVVAIIRLSCPLDSVWFLGPVKW